MKNIGIVAEFNPFHRGHEYFINEARRRSNAEGVVVVMSGDYVQRGEPALWDKFTRAKTALLGGADLVLELPCAFSTGSAADFAFGAVSLLNKLGVVDELWFGSESGELRLFDRLSEMFTNEPEEYRRALKRNLRLGMSYPKARSEAAVEMLADSGFTDPCLDIYDSKSFAFADTLREFLSSPNNILGLEYCAALKKLQSRIAPRTIKREGAGYNDDALHKSVFSSASAIRKALNMMNADFNHVSSADFLTHNNSTQDKAILPSLPSFYPNVFDCDKLFKCGIYPDDFSLILKYKLLTETAESLCAYHDIGEDLARRIKQNENSFEGFTQFAALIKTKNVTYSHICRSLLKIVLSITEDDYKAALNLPYIRVLGINKNRPELLSGIKKRSSVSLCTKPSDLCDNSYDKDLFASNLYESVFADKFGTVFRHEYTRPVELVETDQSASPTVLLKRGPSLSEGGDA